jgi:hypothetical protein
MHPYQACCDDFYCNMYLHTEMRLPQNRETVLHFFDHVRRRFPIMTNFYARQRGEFCIDQEKLDGQYRWVSIEPQRLTSGAVNPDALETAIQQHQTILDMVPYELSIGHLDCESLNLTMGFDYQYRGNHSELLAEALGMVPALERLANATPEPLLGYEPSLQFALDSDYKTQCRVSFETRSSAYQVRTGDYGEEALSVFLTVRRYSSLNMEEEFSTELGRLAIIAEKLVNEYLVENVLQPLQKTIALK